MPNTVRNRRAQRTAQAILAAALEIMTTDGVNALTHQRVAEVAGVGRATVYRHWPSMDDLIIAVFEDMPFPFLEPGEQGEFEERLRRGVAWVGAAYSSERMKSLLLSAAERATWDERTRLIREGLVAQANHNILAAIQEAPPQLRARLITEDPGVLISMLLGPLWFRALIQFEVVDDFLVDTVITSIFQPRID